MDSKNQTQKREIKFRAWHTTSKVMEYEGLPYGYDSEYWDGVNASHLELLNIILKKGNIIFMQYTGLKDKNGKEIYEGDIVMPVGYNELVKFGVVVYSIERGGFDILLNNVDSMSFDDHDHFYGSDFEKCEIIGNIYENPELLKNE